MELTAQDLKNLRVLLNRVPCTGVDEARVVAVLAGKLDALLAAPPEDPSE
jgi:hypothetical protein